MVVKVPFWPESFGYQMIFEQKSENTTAKRSQK